MRPKPSTPRDLVASIDGYWYWVGEFGGVGYLILGWRNPGVPRVTVKWKRDQ